VPSVLEAAPHYEAQFPAKRHRRQAGVRAAVTTGRRQRQRPLQEAGGGDTGGRYTNRAAYEEAAVTGSGRRLAGGG
jgi:hypothetical protein